MPLVTADDGSAGVDDVTLHGLDAAALEELLIAVDGEAHLLALRLVGHLQAGLRRGSAHVVLGELAQRELQAGEHGRRDGPQHVRLILAPVGGPGHERLAVTPYQPCVVAGGDTRQAQLAGEAGERSQTHGVAVHAGIGRLAAEIAALKRAHDGVLELPLEVEDVVREPELRGRAGGALQCTGRAAAAPVRPRPQLRGRRLQAAAFADEPERRDGAIHPAAQCDECSCAFGSALRICSTSASRPLFTR